jgi:hypothetical protein
LYKCVGEALITKQLKEKINAVDIASWSTEGQLRDSDLIVHPFKIDWGNGEKYPLDTMVFFDQENPDEPCKLHLKRFETTQYRPK